ncbi:23S rRNA (guanosine(2251)-2'-O)-methyltransferase RlmB [Sulfuriflexus sp.]|uniref:23S rRNA (guanosine(2251)-2'-O)-methyltransferase RlmB n=1 Tax=Sulfuriflexus sp. TaxID=2015443 RepID=UPI0028CEEAB2|nr:23S rRNA (guanosine(2251)-2'-O)-methyltransferase RlmB [Sulfuriflexus sp.]MDT8405245.1 23S rRNA (guanosine(2251)-2'-O)-methyltransferase RlmB [Sulfuriflexus sp.]
MADTDIIYGIHAVEAILARDPSAILEVWIDKARHDQRLGKLIEQIRQQGLAIQELKKDQLNDLTGADRHQGVAVRCRVAAAKNENHLQQLLDGLSVPPLLLVLDGVQDPHNLGACLRTADAVGVHAVIAPKDRAATLNATVRKVASGAAESVPFITVTNLARSLRALQERGIWLVGAAGETQTSVYEADLKGPLAIVMGAEGKGLRRLTRETCDVLVKIPMRGSVESLNVSVATAVCLYEAVRQRGI